MRALRLYRGHEPEGVLALGDDGEVRWDGEPSAGARHVVEHYAAECHGGAHLFETLLRRVRGRWNCEEIDPEKARAHAEMTDPTSVFTRPVQGAGKKKRRPPDA